MRYFAQERKLYGTRMALGRLIRRDSLPLIGYLILAAGTAFTFQQEHSHAAQATRNLAAANRQSSHKLAEATYNVLYAGCVSGNELRTTLQSLILNPQAVALDKQLVREGRLTQKELDRAIKIARHEQDRIAPRDCRAAYAALKPPSKF